MTPAERVPDDLPVARTAVEDDEETTSTIAILVYPLAPVFLLTILLPPLLGLSGIDMCSGPFKGLASMIADMTGNDVC